MLLLFINSGISNATGLNSFTPMMEYGCPVVKYVLKSSNISVAIVLQ